MSYQKVEMEMNVKVFTHGKWRGTKSVVSIHIPNNVEYDTDEFNDILEEEYKDFLSNVVQGSYKILSINGEETFNSGEEIEEITYKDEITEWEF